MRAPRAVGRGREERGSGTGDERARAESGRQGECIVICWLVTLRGVNGFGKPGDVGAANETKLGGRRSAGFMCGNRVGKERNMQEREDENSVKPSAL